MEDFTTEIFSKWINIFLNDLANKKEKVIAAIDEFPGDKETARIGIEQGPDALKKDIKSAKTMMDFISFYATGFIQNLEVREKNE